MFDRRDRSRSRDREEERGRDGRERGREQYGQSRYGVYAPPPASSSSSKDLATAAATEEDPGYDDAALQESYQAAQTGSAAPVAAPSSSWLSPYLTNPSHHPTTTAEFEKCPIYSSSTTHFRDFSNKFRISKFTQHEQRTGP